MHFINSAFKLLNLRSKMLETFGQVRTYHRDVLKSQYLRRIYVKAKDCKRKVVHNPILAVLHSQKTFRQTYYRHSKCLALNENVNALVKVVYFLRPLQFVRQGRLTVWVRINNLAS